LSQQIRDQLQATLSGTYTLERELGGGGMSKVFVAEEHRLKRKVVVKVLSPELAQGISVERFEREIQTAAALQQANIVPVLSAGESNGLPFYTMPFVEGESLRARLARGPLAVTEAIGVLRDVSKALAYAHQRGVVHRDIKPDNVLLSGGTAVVTDFGIAKAISAARTQSGGATLTQIGTSIGTPAYMAPEQAAGDPEIDHRADIYALGAMAYELLSGQAVFAARTPQRMLAAHMGEAPKPITEHRGDLPAPLVELVMACLAKEPADRPQQASDVVRMLETITSGSGMQAMPSVLLGGAGMFRKALAMYAGAFIAVAVLAKAAIVGIGLPDWVFPGSLIVMALGFPVVLWTGYVQRVARRAITATPTYTPGGSPVRVQGTMATMALKAAPQMTWRRTARGGVYAVGTFVALIAAFMALRALGIGPFGSLIASGAFKARDRVIITDFTVSNGDSALGRVVGDAIRAGLGDSRVITLVTPSEIGGALQRMQQPPAARVNLALARQIALREGVKAIVDGDVTLVGTSYIVATRLVTADSGRELASFRGTASGSDAIITVADDLSRKLRARAGESLRRVQGTPALAYASTSSLDALRKYSEGVRANDAERDYMRAIRLLREAVALDSNFAEGWRKLAVAIRNTGGFPPSVSDSAIARAFQLRDRMTERERDAVLAYYYSSSPGYDRAKAIATYERMLARGDSLVALNNLATQYRGRRELARAESLFRAAIAVQPANQSAMSNLLGVLTDQGKLAAVDSVIAEARKRFPAATTFNQAAINRLLLDGRLDEAAKALDSAKAKGDPRSPSWAVGRLAGLAFDRGRLRESRELALQSRGIDSARGQPQPAVFMAAGMLNALQDIRAPYDAQLKAFDDAVEKAKIDEWPLSDRPYLWFAELNAKVGRTDRARAWIAKYDAAIGHDTALKRWDTPDVQHVQYHMALSERRWSEAADLIRKSDRRPDGPASACTTCLQTELIDLFATAGLPDSALAIYAEYRRSPIGSRPRQGPDREMGAARIEALAKMFDAKGDTANAVVQYREFIELWKNADPELQPRIAAARDRLAQLTPVERAKR
jgi:tRNA A-37 threonylcarbamoyl transferase component Bud32/tetratricopeptide (TPR) repeat protein